MKRRDALLLLFAAGGALAQDVRTYTTHGAVTGQTLKMVIPLEDQDSCSDLTCGIHGFEVTYKGQTKTISAAEVWEALK